MPRVPGLLERFYQPLYDTQEVTPLTTHMKFFEKGYKDGRTQELTNMDLGGCLPYPKNFQLHGVSVQPDLSADIEEVRKFTDGAWFRLFIGTKDYLVVPLSLVLDIPEEEKTTTSCKKDVAAELKRLLSKVTKNQPAIELPEDAVIDLIPLQSFFTSIVSPAPQKISQNFKLKTILYGYYLREVH